MNMINDTKQCNPIILVQLCLIKIDLHSLYDHIYLGYGIGENYLNIFLLLNTIDSFQFHLIYYCLGNETFTGACICWV